MACPLRSGWRAGVRIAVKHVVVAPYLPGELRPRLQGMLEGLAAWGDSVLLVGLDTGEPWSVPTGVRVIPVPVATMRARVRAACALATGRSASVAWCAEPAWRVAVRSALRDESPDRVHVEHVRCASLLPELKEYPGTFDAVDCVSALYGRIAAMDPAGPGRWVRRREAAALSDCERAVGGWARRVVATTAAEAALLSDSIGHAVRELGNAPPRRAACGVPGEAPARAVVVGRWRHPPNRAGLEWLLEAVWPQVLRRVPDARLRIAGPGLGRLATPPQVTASLERVGWVPSAMDLHAGCRVALAPVRVGAGISNKCLEALAAGLPVVATRVVAGEFSTAVAAGAVQVADAPEDFADRIVALFADSGTAGRQGDAGRAWAQAQADWRAIAGELREPWGSEQRP